MKKYKYRYLRKISTTIRIAYLTTAILWGIATYKFCDRREQLKKDYNSKEITHKEYIEQGIKFSKQEEMVFKQLSATLGLIFIGDCTFGAFEEGREY